jgi:competence protein ComEC
MTKNQINYDYIIKAPLLWAAGVLGAGIVALSVFFPAVWPNALPASEVSRFAQDTPLWLGGTVISEVERDQNDYGQKTSRFVLKSRRLWKHKGAAPIPVQGKTKVYLSQSQALAYGDEIVVKGELDLPKALRNPGGFDQKAFLGRQGIHTLFYGANDFKPLVLRKNQGNFLKAWALKTKRFLSSRLDSAFDPRQAGFLKALFLGDKGGVEEEFKDLFAKTGTLHILAVSGFNTGFLAVSVWFLLKPFAIARDIKLFLTLGAIWFYCFVVGWQAPMVRASVMASALILGKILGRKTSALNALGLAALVILLVQPRQIFDVGFQLSFLAVAAIILFFPIFCEKPVLFANERWTWAQKGIFYFRELFWVSFVCLVVTLPVTVQNFYIVTPLSLAANLVIVPVSFLVFFAGIVFFLTTGWAPAFLCLAPLVMKGLIGFFIVALEMIERLPGAYFITGKLNLFLWLLMTAGIGYFLWTQKIKRPLARAGVILIFLSGIFLAQEGLRRLPRDFQMTVLDVGQGDAIYLEFPKGGNLLMDAGQAGQSDRGRWVVGPFLRFKGVRTIDLLAISHPQADHIGGMPYLLEEFQVKKVMGPGKPYSSRLYKNLKEKIKKEKARVISASEGMEIKDFKDVQIFVLNPRKDQRSKNINNDSVVLKVVYGRVSFLLTGDIEEEGMRRILTGRDKPAATVLKVPHHGAELGGMGAGFVRSVDPQVSVISVGEKNRFKHPSPKTLQVLESIPGHRVYRTDQNYAVSIRSDGVGFKVSCLK